MQGYARATVEGFVTHEPVFKTTKTGKFLCTFSLAIAHYSKTDEPPRVSFLDCEAWEGTAKHLEDKKMKGKRVIVMGTLRQDRWENEKGKTESRLKIIADEIRIMEVQNG